MTRQHRRGPRTGSVLPLLIIAIIVLMAMIALAVDIGLLATPRTQAQAVAHLAALAGARQLNGDTSDSSNLDNVNTAIATAKDRADDNTIIRKAVTAPMLTVASGIYTYDPAQQRFVDTYPSSPGTNAWSVIKATLNTTTPAYFGRVFGMNAFNVKATAIAAHRPRDLALVLDFSGSMRFGCQSGFPPLGTVYGSLNPDPIYPQFGHYSAISQRAQAGSTTTPSANGTGYNPMQRTVDYVDSGGETHAQNNLTLATSGGDPIVQDFLTKDSSGNFLNAFYQPQSDATYSATQTPVAMPAPNNFKDQSDSPATYVGDKWARVGKATSGTNLAQTAADYLNISSVSNSTRDTTFESNSSTGAYGANFNGHSMGSCYYSKAFRS